jgi:hypothetical protein
MAEGWDFAVGMDIDGDFGVENEVPEDYNLSPGILQMCQNVPLLFINGSGEHPRNFTIHPSGNWILVANQDTRLNTADIVHRQSVRFSTCGFHM